MSKYFWSYVDKSRGPENVESCAMTHLNDLPCNAPDWRAAIYQRNQLRADAYERFYRRRRAQMAFASLVIGTAAIGLVLMLVWP
jgi:hypothetical protein